MRIRILWTKCVYFFPFPCHTYWWCCLFAFPVMCKWQLAEKQTFNNATLFTAAYDTIFNWLLVCSQQGLGSQFILLSFTLKWILDRVHRTVWYFEAFLCEMHHKVSVYNAHSLMPHKTQIMALELNSTVLLSCCSCSRCIIVEYQIPWKWLGIAVRHLCMCKTDNFAHCAKAIERILRKGLRARCSEICNDRQYMSNYTYKALLSK